MFPVFFVLGGFLATSIFASTPNVTNSTVSPTGVSCVATFFDTQFDFFMVSDPAISQADLLRRMLALEKKAIDLTVHSSQREARLFETQIMISARLLNRDEVRVLFIKDKQQRDRGYLSYVKIGNTLILNRMVIASGSVREGREYANKMMENFIAYQAREIDQRKIPGNTDEVFINLPDVSASFLFRHGFFRAPNSAGWTHRIFAETTVASELTALEAKHLIALYSERVSSDHARKAFAKDLESNRGSRFIYLKKGTFFQGIAIAKKIDENWVVVRMMDFTERHALGVYRSLLDGAVIELRRHNRTFLVHVPRSYINLEWRSQIIMSSHQLDVVDDDASYEDDDIPYVVFRRNSP